MKNCIASLILGVSVVAVPPVFGENRVASGLLSESAEACFRQTVKLNRGADPMSLDTAACDRALQRGPRTPVHQSAMLHNRALIEIAQGDLQSARTSLEAAVAQVRDIGPQHLALAQVAVRQGDYRRAAQLYALMLTDEASHPLITANRDVIQRNHDRLSPEEGVAFSSP